MQTLIPAHLLRWGAASSCLLIYLARNEIIIVIDSEDMPCPWMTVPCHADRVLNDLRLPVRDTVYWPMLCGPRTPYQIRAELIRREFLPSEADI